jgi:Flp pilus assembly protein TadD
MKRAFVTSSLLAAVVVFSACRSHRDLSRTETQDNFGVQMARTNLWREAQFRFQRAVELNPQNAMAHNNLAVALEANGDFEKARREYLEALKLDKGNQYIQKNYSRFTEFLQRNKKRQQRNATASATTTPPAAKSAPATVPLPPPVMSGADSPAPPQTPPPQPPGGSL